MKISRAIDLGVLQFPHVWGDKRATLARLEETLSRMAGSGEQPPWDLVLLPELAFSGYLSPEGDVDVRPFAEPIDGPLVQEVAALAARFRTAIAMTMVEGPNNAAGRFYNTMLLVDETGRVIGHWRKRHPWYVEHWATPGDLGTPVVEWRGIKITGAICFDLHFLAEDAAEELAQSDLLLFPTAWVESGRDSRVPMLRQLARQFGMVVANANWARGCPVVAGQGTSLVLDAQGKTVAQAQDASPCVLRTKLQWT